MMELTPPRETPSVSWSIRFLLHELRARGIDVKDVQVLTIKTRLFATDSLLLGSTWQSNQSHVTLGRVSQTLLVCQKGEAGWEWVRGVGADTSAGVREQSCPMHAELRPHTLNQDQTCIK